MEESNMVFIEGDEMPEVEFTTTMAVSENEGDVWAQYKTVQLLLPLDTEVVSVTAVSSVPNSIDGRYTQIIASCFPSDVDLHDCITGYSYRKDEEGKLYLVMGPDDDYEEREIPDIEGFEDNFTDMVKTIIDETEEINEKNFDK